MTKRFALAAFILSSLLLTSNARADQTTCNLSPSFSLLKNRANQQPRSTSSWQILYKGRLVYELNQAELNDIYGGYTDGHGGNPPIDCKGIVVSSNFFAFVMGWKNDLLFAVGTELSPAGLHGVKILRYYAHDGGMNVSVNSNQLVANYGRLHDLWARFCWSPKNDRNWWHNADHRSGSAGPCVNDRWPWEYNGSNVTEVLFK
jgi:hypothetical protein